VKDPFVSPFIDLPDLATIKMHLLVIEDNADLAANIGEYLEEHGDVVDYAADGLSGLHLAAVNHYDVVVLDLNLPGLDGMSLCRRLRQDGHSTVPLLMLTARDTEQDKVSGLDAGADDYLTKPFSLAELHARLRALARRGTSSSDVLRVADLSFDVRTLIAKRGDRRLELTRAGLKLLEALMRAAPGVLDRAAAERAIWGDAPPDGDASLRGHIHALRRLIDEGEPMKLLHTLHGVGYRMAPDATR
jgi:DNA-binding response OmpR family regulator